MQRMIEATLINELLKKYQGRLEECQNKWEEDFNIIKTSNKKEIVDNATDNLTLVNVQIGTYECIVKDLKELVK